MAKKRNGKPECHIFEWGTRVGVCTGRCHANNGGNICHAGIFFSANPGEARRLRKVVSRLDLASATAITAAAAVPA